MERKGGEREAERREGKKREGERGRVGKREVKKEGRESCHLFNRSLYSLSYNYSPPPPPPLPSPVLTKKPLKQLLLSSSYDCGVWSVSSTVTEIQLHTDTSYDLIFSPSCPLSLSLSLSLFLSLSLSLCLSPLSLYLTLPPLLTLPSLSLHFSSLPPLSPRRCCSLLQG